MVAVMINMIIDAKICVNMSDSTVNRVFFVVLVLVENFIVKVPVNMCLEVV